MFISNLLEHLEDKSSVVKVLFNANRILKYKGKIIILQPNIDLIREKYWDRIDHQVALNSNSVKEALAITNFKVEKYIKRFLPTTMENNIPVSKIMIRSYLALPQEIRPFAGQSLFIAIKK